MTGRVRSTLSIKPTDALNSSFIGITTLHVSDSLSAHHQEFLAVHRHWYILCSFDDRCYQEQDGTPWSSILLKLSETAHSPSKHKDRHGFFISQCKHTEL